MRFGISVVGHLWVDAGYGGKLAEWVRQAAGWQQEVVAKPPGATTFTV